MRRHTSIISILSIVALLTSCTGKQGKTHVILIGMDGWGAYCLPKADMPVTKQLMENGAYTLEKRAVMPSVSGLNWASMFMGASPELHGYTTWASETPEIPSRAVYKHNIFPTIGQVIRDQRPDFEMGCIHEWSTIKYLIDTLAFNYVEHTPHAASTNDKTCELAEQYIKSKKPDFLIITFDEPDGVGHTIGHDTPEYYQKVHELDGCIGRIVQATKDAGIYKDAVFILTADHGGINTAHGGRAMVELQIPFIICGKGIKKMGKFSEAMMQYDTAPTIARIFGVEPPQVWNGRPMLQVFE